MKPTIANPVRFLDHCIVWDENEGAFLVFVVGDSPANFLFHATTIDACVEAIAEVVGESMCLSCGAEPGMGTGCEDCTDAEVAELAEKIERRAAADELAHDCAIDGCVPSSNGPDDGLACDAGHTSPTAGCEACGPGIGVTCKACGYSGNPEAVSMIGALAVCPRCTCYDPELVELVAAVLP